MARQRRKAVTQSATRDELAEAVRDALRRGFTQTQIAERAGVSQQTISNLVRGKPKLSPGYRRRIAESVGIDVAPSSQREAAAEPVFTYCANPLCCSLTLAANDGKLYIAPRFRRSGAPGKAMCRYCDSKLLKECPRCTTSITQEWLICETCGFPFVETPPSMQGLAPERLEEVAERWDSRNRRIRTALHDD